MFRLSYPLPPRPIGLNKGCLPNLPVSTSTAAKYDSAMFPAPFSTPVIKYTFRPTASNDETVAELPNN